MSNMNDNTSGKATFTRRKFVATSAVGIAAITIPGLTWGNKHQIKAILFDAFVIFNPQPVVALTEKTFQGKATELLAIWRDKQFEYCWLRTAGGKYKNFYKITADALTYAVNKTGLSISPDQHKELMQVYLNLDIWPDVLPALKQLKDGGVRLSFLSNFTAEMMNSSLQRNQIAGYFEHLISTDNAQMFKPNPQAYQLGVSTLKLKKEEILFAAFAGWDAAGAKWFGYPTYWVNRTGMPSEELDTLPNGQGRALTDLLAFLDSKS
jgi:2-haloacid dehalogenase